MFTSLYICKNVGRGINLIGYVCMVLLPSVRYRKCSWGAASNCVKLSLPYMYKSKGMCCSTLPLPFNIQYLIYIQVSCKTS